MDSNPNHEPTGATPDGQPEGQPDQGATSAKSARLRLAILTGMTVGASVVAVVTTHEPGTTSISVSLG